MNNFPSSPTAGQVHTFEGKSWTWDATKAGTGAWILQQPNLSEVLPAAAKALAIAASFDVTAPINPVEGKVWVNPATGREYKWHVGVASSQWVETGAVQVVGSATAVAAQASADRAALFGWFANSIQELIATSTAQYPRTQVLGYFAAGDAEPSVFQWDAARPKIQHDGGRIISPTVPWVATAAYLSGTGEAAVGSTGCWVRVESELRVSWYGVTATSTAVRNKAAVQKFVASACNLYFDRSYIDIGVIAPGERVLPLTLAHSFTSWRGPCKLSYDGPTSGGATLLSPRNGHDIVISDLQGEDRLNKSANMTTQDAGVCFFNLEDFADGSTGCYRITLVRPAAYGGTALYHTYGLTYGTTGNQCRIIDGHAQDTYYGINTAGGADQLRANIRCIRVKRAYFGYEVRDQEIDVLSEEPGNSNAHFLIKSYHPQGTHNLKCRFVIRGDGSQGYGRLVFELQDEAGDDALIENVDVEIFDERTGGDAISVAVRAWANPTTIRTVSNSRLRNVVVSGKAWPPYYYSKLSRLTTMRWLAADPVYYGINLWDYSRLYSWPHCDVVFMDGPGALTIALEGVAGTGINQTIPLVEALFGARTNASVSLRVRATAYQGDLGSMNNHSLFEQDLLLRAQGGVVTLSQSAIRNGLTSSSATIQAVFSIVGNKLNVQCGALGGQQYLVLRFDLV